MWHTSTGDRTLEGAEAAMVKESIGCMADDLDYDDESDPSTYGVGVFDELSRQQRAPLLLEVARGLLIDSEAMPQLTAVSEGAVAAIYGNLRQHVGFEIDGDTSDEMRCYWRRLILAAISEIAPDDQWREDSDDLDQWRDILNALEDCILWDTDYAMAGAIMDVSPRRSRLNKKWLGIPDDYYTAIAPDARDNQIKGIISELRALCD
jgi:hypothetical protein